MYPFFAWVMIVPQSDRKLFRDDKAKLEERNGEIRFQVFSNDGSDFSMLMLTGMKNIFQKQLPKMPKDYIARLVYDPNHKSLAIVTKQDVVVGGICYRLFLERNFLEIVFCAITSSEQVKGYGSYLMNNMKNQARKEGDIQYFLTYADNYAVGYFKKQGFSKEITLDKSVWAGYIKDYDGGTLMECKLIPKINYLEIYQTLHLQKQALYELLKGKSKSHIIRPGLHCKVPIEQIPGLVEAGWSKEMEMSVEPKKNRLYEFMKSILSEIQNHAASWPFMQPVNIAEVTDYYDVIKQPMDLSTMESKIEKENYQNLNEFVYDFQLIVDNCRLYNLETTQYHKCANMLEEFFKSRLKARQFKE